MFVPPLIVRELRAALRKRQLRRTRLGAAALGAGMSAVFMLWGLLAGNNSWGRSLHRYLFYVGLYYAVLRPAQACIGLFSEERRQQTLELLYLTGMTSTELFGGKLLGGFLAASGELMALVPFLALPFLSGGVSMSLYLATVICLPLLLLFSVSVAVLASVICKEDGAAFVVGLVLAGVLTLGTTAPYFLGKILAGTAPFSPAWLWFSPGYGAFLVGSGFSNSGAAEFWPTAGVTLAWGMLCLTTAALILRRTWREEPERALRGWRYQWQVWVRGTAPWRLKLRARVLEQNAFQWLVQRDRKPELLAWACLGMISVIWLAGWCAWPRYWPSTMNFFVTAMLLLVLVDGLEMHAAAKRLGHDRRDGVLELLLTTPLTPLEIVNGELEGLRAQFRPIRRILAAVYLLMVLGGWLSQKWSVKALISYLLIWSLFFVWGLRRHRSVPLVMWVALNTGRPGFAVFRSHGGGWQWFWILFNGRNITSTWGRSAIHFPSGSTTELVVVAILVPIMVAASLAKRQELVKISNLLVQDMRVIAQAPVPDPQDPMVKHWNVHERLIPARG